MSVWRSAAASSVSTSSTGWPASGIGTSPSSRKSPHAAAAPGCRTASLFTTTPPTSSTEAITVCGVGPSNSTNSTRSDSQTSTALKPATGVHAGAGRNAGAGWLSARIPTVPSSMARSLTGATRASAPTAASPCREGRLDTRPVTSKHSICSASRSPSGAPSQACPSQSLPHTSASRTSSAASMRRASRSTRSDRRTSRTGCRRGFAPPGPPVDHDSSDSCHRVHHKLGDDRTRTRALCEVRSSRRRHRRQDRGCDDLLRVARGVAGPAVSADPAAHRRQARNRSTTL